MVTTLARGGGSKIRQPLKLHLLSRICMMIILFSWKATGQSYPTFQISDSNSIFQNQFLDTSDGSLYMGGLNFIYKLNSDLDLLRTEETGPVDDNPNCRPPPQDCTEARVSTDNYNKVILLHEQHLITCGSIYQGTCRIRDPDTLGVTFNDSIREVVPNTASGLAVAFVGIGDNDEVLYVASSYGDWLRDVPTVSTRVISRSMPENKLFKVTADNAQITIPTSTLNESPAGQTFNISYIYGFTSGLFSYFTGSQPSMHDTISRYTSKLVRLCHGDPNFRSYIELALVCGFSEDNDYNLIQSAYLASLSLNGDESKDILVASFSKSDTLTSSIPSTESAICIYDVEDINQAFYNRRLDCAQQGTDNTGIRWAGSTNCRENTFLADFIRSRSPAEYCHTTETQFPLGDDRRVFTISATPVYQTTSQITAVAAVQHFETSIIISGDASGNFKKLRLTGSTAEEYDSLNIHGTPIIRNALLLSQDEEFIFITSEDQITRIPVEECFEYTTCEECHRSRDPYCGWCSLQARCTQRIDSQCKASQNGTSLRWLSSSENCLAITAVTPEFVPEQTITELTISVSSLPVISLGSMTCEFYDGTVVIGSQSATIMQDMSSVTCSTPDNIVASTNGFKTVHLQLHYQEDGNDQNIASIPINFYACGRLTSCSECAGNKYGCKWCLHVNRCIDPRYDCDMGVVLIKSSVCPLILGSNELLIPAGTRKGLSFYGINLPNETFSFTCKIQFTTLDELSIPARVINNQIICDDHLYVYSSSAESITGSLRVFWRNYSIDTESVLLVTIYKCSRMAITIVVDGMNKPTCGMCLSINAIFGCSWCPQLNDCLFTDGVNTCGENERFFPRMSCPDPTIANIFPSSGHVSGGTIIAIHGYNLGFSVAEIENISVAGIPCITMEFVSPQMLYCTTGRSSSYRSGNVVVTFNNNRTYPVESKQTFSFVTPKISSVEPTRGPRSGGTRLIVRGIHLDAGLKRSVTISTTPCVPGTGYSCEIIEELTDPVSTIVCKTSAGNVTSGYLSVTFDGGCESGENKFVYKEDPIVNEFERLSAIASGGLDIYIDGSSFDVIQQARLEFRVGTFTFTSNCSNTTRTLSCKSPDITTSKAAYPLSLPVSNISLCMDDVASYKDLGPTFPNSRATQFVFFEDPVYVQLPRGGNMIQIPHGSQNGYHVKIRGENLTLASTHLDVSVTIGREACAVLHLSTDCLTCLPPLLPPGIYDVQVLHGNLQFTVGSVEYQAPQTPVIVILLCALCILMLACVCLITLFYYLHTTKIRKEKSFQNSHFAMGSQKSASNINIDDDKMSDHTYCSQDMDYQSISSTNTNHNDDQTPPLPSRNQTPVDIHMEEISANNIRQSNDNQTCTTSTSDADGDQHQSNVPNREGDHEEEFAKYSNKIYDSDETSMPYTTGTQLYDDQTSSTNTSEADGDQHQAKSPNREGEHEEEFAKYSNKIYGRDEKSMLYTTGTQLTEFPRKDDEKEGVSTYSRGIYDNNAT